MNSGTRGGRGPSGPNGQPPHPATVVQRKMPHPATSMQPQSLHPAKAAGARLPPHAATVGKPRTPTVGPVLQRASTATKLEIISWNVRHLRRSKVADYWEYFRYVVEDAHICFLYENKIDNDGGDFARFLKKWVGEAMNAECGVIVTPVETNENVITVYRKKVGGMNLVVQADDSYRDELIKAAKKAISASMNATVMGNRSMDRADARVPAIVDVTLGAMTLKIAAWHAPGPATALPGMLFRNYATVLYNDVDLYVGDFNMTGLTRDMVDLVSPVQLVRTRKSTTITAIAPVYHEEGLDLVYRHSLRLWTEDEATKDDGKAQINVGVLHLPVKMTYEQAFKCSDHLPVWIDLEW